MESGFALGIQKELQQPSFDYKGLGSLGSGLALSGDSLKQQEVSKVSTHQGNHYINIEQHVSPHQGSSTEDANGLEHEKGESVSHTKYSLDYYFS